MKPLLLLVAWWLIAPMAVERSCFAATAFDIPRPFRHKGHPSFAPPQRQPACKKQDLVLASHELSAVRGGGGSDASSTTLSYYLLWSPGILPRTMASFGLLMALKVSVGDRMALFSSGVPTPVIGRFLDLIVIPLLSSACCAIQVLMNVMVGASGCAGFNKHLGPLRPYFLGILLSTVASTMMTGSAVGKRVLVQVLLAFLPEWIHLYNLASSRLVSRTQKLKSALSSSTTIAQIELDIPGMGCVACINKINGSLRQVPGVTESDAWLLETGGKAKVKCLVGSVQDAQEVATKLTTAVRNAGFDPCIVDSLELKV